MKAHLTILLPLSVCLFSPVPSMAQSGLTIDNIDDFQPPSGQTICNYTPTYIKPPGWEWNCDGSIQNMKNGHQYITCPQTGTGDICGNSEWNTTISKDKSREVDPSWTYTLDNGLDEYGGVNFHASLNSATNGNLDTTDTIFRYDVWVYYTDLSNINQLEFDLNQVLENTNQSTDVIQFATQCNLDTGNFGSYFDPSLSGYWNYTVNGQWTKEPNIPCLRTDWTENQWHHVIIGFHRGPHTRSRYCLLRLRNI